MEKQIINTETGHSLTHNDLVGLLEEWGTDIQTGEQYSVIKLAHLMLACLNNMRENYAPEMLSALDSSLNPAQKAVFIKLANALKNHIDD